MLSDGAASPIALDASTMTELLVYDCCFHINSHNQVRGRKTGPKHSGAEKYTREKAPTNQRWYITADAIHASTRHT